MFRSTYQVVQDTDKALDVMRRASEWLVEIGKPAKHWNPADMNRQSMLKHAEPSEFYVVLVGGKPAAAAILQDSERNQSWASVDKGEHVSALYVHWLAVAPEFQGKGLPKILTDFAAAQAKARGLTRLRLDANAKEPKLMKVYDDLGFELVHIEPEADQRIAFYQKVLA